MKRTMIFAAVVATAALTPMTPALASGVTDGTLAEARAATARFHSVEVALAAGYAPASPCEPGQGIHYVNADLASNPTLDVRTPEVLLYEPQGNGKLKLVGVEYVRFYPGEPNPTNPPYQRDPNGPAMFGVQFHGKMAGHGGPMPVHHELHVWVWRHSPEGMFESHNSRITCP